MQPSAPPRQGERATPTLPGVAVTAAEFDAVYRAYLAARYVARLSPGNDAVDCERIAVLAAMKADRARPTPTPTDDA